MNKKVSCITDADPEKKSSDGRWRACFPFDLQDNDDYKSLASHVLKLKADFEEKYDNIKIYHPEGGKGKTLEYEFARYNPISKLIFTDSFPGERSPNNISNLKELQAILIANKDDWQGLIIKYNTYLTTDKSKEKFKKIEEGVISSSLIDSDKAIAIFSAIYYNTVSDLKGEHALYLEGKLRDDLESDEPKFNVPEYITNAITKILQ